MNRIQKLKALCSLLLLAATTATFTASAQTAAQIQQAKAMGITEAEIAAFQQQNAGTPTQASKGTTARGNTTRGTSSLRDEHAMEVVYDLNTTTSNEAPATTNVFGREVFASENLTFAPSANIATSPTYVLGPNDEVIIEAWGSAEFYNKQRVTPEGKINIPRVGPIHVAGMSVEKATELVKSKVAQMMSGIHLSLSVGAIRSIKVNIAGEIRKPGTYTLPSLATLFNALYIAGGVNNIGSLREIKVYRNSQEIGTLDVYDYLLKGEYNTNIRLEDNDMVVVPTYDSYVTIAGKVKRPRTYELKKGETLQTLIDYAGGYVGDAYSDELNVWRKTGTKNSIHTVEADQFGEFTLFDGDSVDVGAIIDDYANRITVEGAVWREGSYELSEKTSTLSELIERAGGLRGDEFASRGQITRRKADYTHEIIPFDVQAVATGATDLTLVAEDAVFIPSIFEMREEYTITVDGEVNAPSTFEFREGMSVEDAILRSGGFRESASLAQIEVARRVKDAKATTYSPKTGEVFLFEVNEDLSLSSDAEGFTLEPFDVIHVRRSPRYNTQKSVTVVGEVLFEGRYALATNGERLSSVISKAGGITPEAYIKGASIQRVMTADEQMRAQALLKVAQNDKSLSDSLNLDLGVDLTQPFPIGVDIEQALKNPGGNNDIILREGDIITIPMRNNTVKISGSVLYPNTVTFDKRKVKHYVSQAGGYNDDARKRPFIIYMNGKVCATRRGFLCKRLPKVEPGCEVVVPVKIRRETNTLGNVMGLMTSTASMAAMIASVINISK